MDYRQQATQWTNAGAVSAGDAAIAFAVLHLAEQVERVADTLDRVTDEDPETTVLLRVTLR